MSWCRGKSRLNSSVCCKSRVPLWFGCVDSGKPTYVNRGDNRVTLALALRRNDIGVKSRSLAGDGHRQCQCYSCALNIFNTMLKGV